MPIPALNKDGLLPEGIHDCTREEIEARFDSFKGTDHRPRLWAAFHAFLEEIKAAGLGVTLLVNGSFVTAKPVREGIDLILVLPTGHDFSRDLSPIECNVLSSRRVRRRHKLDLLVTRADSDQYRLYLSLFQQVRLERGRTKGILRTRV
ncbi:MAG: DUF6932 family protein [Limisphaerales bacterium]